MPTSEEYRRKAGECRRLAELATDESERSSHTKMALQWDQLAKRWRTWKPPKRDDSPGRPLKKKPRPRQGRGFNQTTRRRGHTGGLGGRGLAASSTRTIQRRRICSDGTSPNNSRVTDRRLGSDVIALEGRLFPAALRLQVHSGRGIHSRQLSVWPAASSRKAAPVLLPRNLTCRPPGPAPS
jgi:hypothetical protein